MLFNVNYVRKKLKAEGLVSRDSRSKETQEIWAKRREKRFQYSKSNDSVKFSGF